MKVNIDILVDQYLDDFMENMGDEILLEYAREQLRENIFEFTEEEIIASIDEYYTTERRDNKIRRDNKTK
jgi:hypothetical protein